jgi:aminoglycoside 6'-N-acetyltransferase
MAAGADRLGDARATSPAGIALRPLARADFPDLARWLATPHVARWWSHETSPAALERDFGGCIDGAEATDVFIALHGARAIGLLQRYRIHAYPDYAAELASLVVVPAHAWGIDYLIGEPGALGRGLGTALVAAGVAAIAALDAPAEIIVAVHEGNAASWRALERSGFAYAASGDLTPDNPADDRAHRVYRRVARSSAGC